MGPLELFFLEGPEPWDTWGMAILTDGLDDKGPSSPKLVVRQSQGHKKCQATSR
jgi:hypothetical protein